MKIEVDVLEVWSIEKDVQKTMMLKGKKDEESEIKRKPKKEKVV